MAFFSWKALDSYRYRKVAPEVKFSYPKLEKGELFAVELPKGREFLSDLNHGRVFGIFTIGATNAGKTNANMCIAEYCYLRGYPIIDLHSVVWESLFWARKYPVILVQAPGEWQVKSNNKNIEVYEWSEGFNWLNVLLKAKEEHKILTTSCWLPSDDYYRMLIEFTKVLLYPKKEYRFKRYVLLRDVSQLLPSGLKEDRSKLLTELKRSLLRFVRQGRKVGNRVIADAQLFEDVLRAFRENIWCLCYKHLRGKIPGLEAEINEEVNKLRKDEALMNYMGVWFTARFAKNECNREEDDDIEELGVELVHAEEKVSPNSDELRTNTFLNNLPHPTEIENILSDNASLTERQTDRENPVIVHYEVLRKIARQEYQKAGIPEKIAEQMVEYDFPPDPFTKKWRFKDVKISLDLPIKADSIIKNYQRYLEKRTNKVLENISIRFIDYLIKATPDFPTQTFFSCGAGARDVEFHVDGKFVASANLKLFLDYQPNRQVHMSPEYRDPVHYGIIITAKPFHLKIFKGTGQEYVNSGSVLDLGWAGFVEDLRKEADKLNRRRE